MSPRDFLLVILVCLIWGSNTVVSKLVISGLNVPPLAYAATRFSLVALVTTPWLLPAPRPTGRVIVVALLLGAAAFGLLFVGLRTCSPSAAALVTQLGGPITTLLSVVLLKERLDGQRSLGVLLTFTGVAAAVWSPRSLALSPGLWFVLASTAASSLGAILMKQITGVRPLQFQAWVGLTAAAPLALISLATEPRGLEQVLRAGWPLAVAVVYSAIVVSVVAHTLYYGLIQRHQASLIAPLMLLTPLWTIALGVGLTHDPFDLRMGVGTALALFGVLLVAMPRSQAVVLIGRLRYRVQDALCALKRR